MTIILPFPDGVTSYISKIKYWFWTNSHSCPRCHGRTYRHGSYTRTVYSDCEAFCITIFRIRCPHCKISFSLLPSFIKPYARHLNSYRLLLIKRNTLEGVSIKQTPFINSSNKFAVSPTTFRRWIRKLREIALKVNSHIIARILELSPAYSSPSGDTNAVAFLLETGEVLYHLIVHKFLPGESLESCGLFDLLNLIVPEQCWV